MCLRVGKRLRQREKRKIKWELRKGRKREQGETAKENEDWPDRNLPKDVLVDQCEAKFVEADGQGRAEDGGEQVGGGINESLIMKQKKDAPMPPPGTPHPELEEPEEIWTLTSSGPPCLCLRRPHSI